VADVGVTEITEQFWRGKRVFLTGHTGFKGSWLALWLDRLGADVFGFALAPPTVPSLFEVAKIKMRLRSSTLADIRDAAAVERALRAADPDIVIHMAAQSLVRPSYAAPLETFSVNVMGTAHVLEAARRCPGIRVVVVVSSDKCYENTAKQRPYREIDPMGGHDPYSASKGCAELLTASYAHSFFKQDDGDGDTRCTVASARAGNVIGGGDWSIDRIVPDFFRSVTAGKALLVRNPDAVRPWQHVLEPLGGYLLLAERIAQEGRTLCGGWNFGPDRASCWPVAAVVERLVSLWGSGARWQHEAGEPHQREAAYLSLDSEKARRELGWRPRWSLDEALERTVAWAKAYAAGTDMGNVCRAEIEHYTASVAVH
jgi:CDP-glucose 4,6-dehydratase